MWLCAFTLSLNRVNKRFYPHPSTITRVLNSLHWDMRSLRRSDKAVYSSVKKKKDDDDNHGCVPATSFTLMFLICRLPSSCRDMRGSFPKRLTPSFSQLMEGMGSPDAWHFSRATLSTPSVWLDGPWRMMGGGLSVSTAMQSHKKGKQCKSLSEGEINGCTYESRVTHKCEINCVTEYLSKSFEKTF